MPDPICRASYVRIPAGPFNMGSSDEDYRAIGKKLNCEFDWSDYYDECPKHEVYISDICISEHEVTNAEYSAYVDASGGKVKPPLQKAVLDGPNQSQVNVSWYDAKGYCEWLGCRLPTEAEWEKAAKGGHDKGYFFPTDDGTISKKKVNYYTNRSVDVCSYPKNPYGLCDMAGNAKEWVSDWYSAGAYLGYTYNDPKGPIGYQSKPKKVLKGGSYSERIFKQRLQRRGAANPIYSCPSIGFRCACEVEKAEEKK